MNQYLIVGIVFIVVIALLATNKKLVETLKNIYKICLLYTSDAADE